MSVIAAVQSGIEGHPLLLEDVIRGLTCEISLNDRNRAAAFASCTSQAGPADRV
jgi:hypothetical protein